VCGLFGVLYVGVFVCVWISVVCLCCVCVCVLLCVCLCVCVGVVYVCGYVCLNRLSYIFFRY